jgi:hypothetical protein
MGLVANVKQRVVTSGLDPVDVTGLDNGDPTRGLYDKARCVSLRGSQVCEQR